jgi:hypothetical protein
LFEQSNDDRKIFILPLQKYSQNLPGGEIAVYEVDGLEILHTRGDLGGHVHQSPEAENHLLQFS